MDSESGPKISEENKGVRLFGTVRLFKRIRYAKCEGEGELPKVPLDDSYHEALFSLIAGNQTIVVLLSGEDIQLLFPLAKICSLPNIDLTLPMLGLLLSKAQGCNYFWKPYKPCYVGIH